MARLDKDEVKSLLQRAAVTSIQERGHDAFEESQKKCPVLTGALKQSGKVHNLDNGVEVIYEIHYAPIVEHGFRGGTITIKSYTRKNGTYVASHSYYSPPREGRHFIENALDGSFGDSGLADEFDKQIRLLFGRHIIIRS